MLRKFAFGAIALLAAMSIILVAKAAAQPSLPTSATGGLHCSSFEWVAIGDEPRAALLVPIEIDGHEEWAQLDTGSDVSYLPKRRVNGAGGLRADQVNLGGAEIGPRWFLERGETGTIGLDMLVGYTSIIDFPSERFCVLPTVDLPFELFKNARWANATLRDGKLFLPVESGGETDSAMFLDTGASMMGLNVDLDRWTRLTGQSGPEVASGRITGEAWGRATTLVFSPASQLVAIGPLRGERIPVFHSLGRDNRFASYPFETTGSIGLAPFWNHTLIISLGATPRVGIYDYAPRANGSQREDSGS